MALLLQSSPFSFPYAYDVFLSFRGSDTRFGFTGNLYHALHIKGFRTFIDDRELRGGEEITPSLFKAIEDSRIIIPIFSKYYACSTFCLDELVHTMECFKANNQLVLPIFYDVDPANVRHQTGSYDEAIAKHQERFQNNMETYSTDYLERLHKWKLALNQAANLSGYHFNTGMEYEYEFIEKIVDVISSTINRTPLHVADYPIGLEYRVLQVKGLLKMGSDDGVCIIGIHGIGGIGKTTIAREIYNSIANRFEVLCFLDAVREKTQKLGLVHLQETLLYEAIGEKEIKLGSVSRGISIIKQRLQSKKILLILDDVDDLKQLQVMVGESHWFGPGSRVIITTRDTQLLASHGIKTTYEVEGLNKEEALELLRCKAFKNNKVDSKYEPILKRVVTYASGLPLALEVVGSTLCRKKNIKEWESLLSRYERVPPKNIQKILEVSFNALEKEEQSVFLDIACCLKGYELGEVERILSAHYGVCKKCDIQVLVEKSLIKIHGLYVTLHDLVELMGKEIVRQESPDEIEKRSRLWFHEEIVQVLEDNMGGSQIKMMHLDFPFSHEEEEIEWNGDGLKMMRNLKTLIIKNGRFSQGPEHIPNSLRVLEWYRYPSPNLPSDFRPKKLSICKLRGSYFRSFEFPNSVKKFQSIRELDLSNCDYLTEIHDVSGLTNLEYFSFECCKNLATIHDSVGLRLNKLKMLNAQDCEKLKTFPPLKLTSLEELLLSGCQSLKCFPEVLGEMKNVRVIELIHTSIEELPFSFQNLTGLNNLRFSATGKLRLPSSISGMPNLMSIIVQNYCALLPTHNDNSSSMMSSNVRYLGLNSCKVSDAFLAIFVTWFTNVIKLDVSYSDVTILPEGLRECRFLCTLNVRSCSFLQEIRGIPPHLKFFQATHCDSLTSLSRRMLVNQELHEDGGTDFQLDGNVMMPEWFEHQSRGQEASISFWFRNKVPSIALFLINHTDVRCRNCVAEMFISSGCNIFFLCEIESNRTFLGDLKVVLRHDGVLRLKNDLSRNEWIHAEVRTRLVNGDKDPVEGSTTLVEIGIHVWKQNNSMKDIQFTNPYKRTSLCARVQRLKVRSFRVQQRMKKKGSIKNAQAGRKNYYMLSARDLSITRGDDPMYWSWRTLPAMFRFKETVQLRRHMRLFEIRGKINTLVLSSNTQYVAFLVFKLVHNCYGFDEYPFELSVGRVGGQSCTKSVRFTLEDPDNEEYDQLERPKVRSDGWLEIEIGEFFNSGLEDEEVEMSVLETENYKEGLLLAGIEIRTKE